MSKCMNKAPGGCLVKHGAKFVVGMGIVGAICDYCEAFICHGRQVIQLFYALSFEISPTTFAQFLLRNVLKLRSNCSVDYLIF